MTTHQWFDAHLDLAYLAECGRDMTTTLESCGGPHPPPAVTLPSLREGGVAACLGTIFTEADGEDAVGYPADDVDAAHRRGVAQLDRYHAWREAGLISFFADASDAPLRMGILVECADPIREPDELPWWVERGVVAIGLAWARPSRYAGGNETGLGLTDLGRAMVKAMDDLGVVHDVSHLSQKALDQLLELTDAPVVATHSNVRSLLDGNNERHLSDDAIREIARRGGVIGLNLCSLFLKPGLQRGDRASIDHACAHVQRICELVGSRGFTGLGSDMDGGFSANDLPFDINHPSDLGKVTDALSQQGWSEQERTDFRWNNWARFWKLDGDCR